MKAKCIQLIRLVWWALNQLISLVLSRAHVVRQALGSCSLRCSIPSIFAVDHKRNQTITVHAFKGTNPQLVRVFNQRLLSVLLFSLLMQSQVQAADGHADPHWTYDEQDAWGELKDPLYKPPYPYAECGIGQKQSPVNIDPRETVKVEKIDELQARYVDIPLSLTNNGHTIRANTSQGSLYFGNNEYDLVQFHFHAPSEHRVNGLTYPMEIHFVNGTADGRMAVLGVIVRVGAYNAAFQEILDHSPSQVGQTHEAALMIHPSQLLPAHSEHFYTYAGSLTTPPCSEGIQWFVLQEFLEVSEEQLATFTRKFFNDNARTDQNLNGRKLDMH